MQVVLKITNFPTGSTIGPNFNVIPNVGTSSPAQVTLTDLLLPQGVIVTVLDNVENITLQSIGGTCSSSKKITIDGLCGKPLRCCITTTTQLPTSTTTSQNSVLGTFNSNKSTLTFLDPCSVPGAPSIIYLELTASNLQPNATISVVAPPGSIFTLSEQAVGPWTSFLTFSSTSGGFINPIPKKIYVKFNPPSSNLFTGDIAISSIQATTLTIPVSGSITGSCFSIPFNFAYFGRCSGTNFSIDVPFTVGGVPPYEASVAVYSTQAAALANTNWTSLGLQGAWVWNLGTIPNGTYWMAIKDSTGTIVTNSIVNTCNTPPPPTTTTTIPNTLTCNCYTLTNITSASASIALSDLCNTDGTPPTITFGPGQSDIVFLTGQKAIQLANSGYWSVEPSKCPGCNEYQLMSNQPQTLNYYACNGELFIGQVFQPGSRICWGINNQAPPPNGWFDTNRFC